MPTYPYECEKGHKFEVDIGIHDPRPTKCPVKVQARDPNIRPGVQDVELCGAPVEYTWPPVPWFMSKLI